MGPPFFGEMLSFLWYFKVVGRPDDFISSKIQRYGEGVGLYRSHLLGSPTIISCSPTTNKFIFQSPASFPLHWPSPEIVGESSLVAVHGKQHLRLRNFVMNAINHPVALKRIASAVQPRIVDSLRFWAEKGTIRASDETKKVTFENICKMFVGLDPGPLAEELDRCFMGLVGGFRAYPLDFPGTAFRRALQCRKKLNVMFRRELEKKKKKKKGKEAEDMEGDLMDGLMRMKDEEGKPLSDEEVLDNIISLVVAGYQSTALATMWALYHLAKSPHALHKLREENMALSKKNKGDFITMEDISQLKYTAKVVEETIRLANIAPVLFRAVTRDVDYRGYRIPKGWKVAVWIRSIHTDPKNFEDPLSFNPERWNEPPKPGTFQVFGGGVRICAGNMLVRIQLIIFLHHLALSYKWELINPDVKITYLPHPRPVDGAMMKFSKI
ncbi:Ent-kaurenoic acid oxidase 1 [Acorus calamus]|uniref:Ent-kaurenoic acid oxidase 1 n=1 Tax=Acorus calamus TaxID=4465 RepID=A0AAV9D002_ACOCL|nr:Ent-kaurenoic acid oxidase 1 [Acorus calamus]